MLVEAILGYISILLNLINSGVRIAQKIYLCLRKKDRLILEEVPRERSYIGGNLIIPYNNKAFLLLHIQARNPMSETVYIYEVKVECRDKAKNLIRTELVKPLESLPDIVAKEKVLDWGDTPIEKKEVKGCEDFLIIRNLDLIYAWCKLYVTIIVTDHRGKESKLKCKAVGTFRPPA